MIFEKLSSLFSKKVKSKQEVSNPEMTNVVKSMFLCSPIYDKLKVKCHPDRFIDVDQKAHAENLFQELQKHKHNYDKLLEIEIRISKFIADNSKK